VAAAAIFAKCLDYDERSRNSKRVLFLFYSEAAATTLLLLFKIPGYPLLWLLLHFGLKKVTAQYSRRRSLRDADSSLNLKLVFLYLYVLVILTVDAGYLRLDWRIVLLPILLLVGSAWLVILCEELPQRIGAQ
jgi:hypothetical protein